MEAIIYNSSPQHEALANRLFIKLMASDCPQHIKDGLTSYSLGIIHPTNGKVALAIERNVWYWTYIEDEFTAAELNSIEVLTSDWFPDAV